MRSRPSAAWTAAVPRLARALSTLPILPILVAASLAPLIGLLACGGDGGPPVARLRVEPRELTLAHGTFAEVLLHWDLTRNLDGVSGEPRVFVHLLDDQDRLTRTFDHALPGGWKVGEKRMDVFRVYQSILAPPLPPGDYSLVVGLYDEAGTRWPLEVEGESLPRSEYRVAKVMVPAGPSGSPALAFTPTWSPTMAGADRQTVAVRWVTGDGAIQLSDIEGSGHLWLRLRIPPEGVAGEQRVFRRDAGESASPSVRLVTPCSGFEAFISGDGAHDLEVPVETGDGRCVIRLEPNYAMVSQGLEQQSVLLENIAWRAAEQPAE